MSDAPAHPPSSLLVCWLLACVLSSFGNAKTVNNNNSSRFGKYMEILFDYGGDPVGGRVTNYLVSERERAAPACLPAATQPARPWPSLHSRTRRRCATSHARSSFVIVVCSLSAFSIAGEVARGWTRIGRAQLSRQSTRGTAARLCSGAREGWAWQASEVGRSVGRSVSHTVRFVVSSSFFVCFLLLLLQVFYQVCSGATAAERQAYCLENADYYYYLSVSGCYQVPGINDAEDWREMTESMRTVGINEAERQEVIRSIAVCLWLGNVAFEERKPEVAEVRDRAVLDIVAGLLQVQPAALEAALCNRQIQTGVGARAEKYVKPNTAAASDFSRDTLAKAIFTRLFDYLVAKINISIQKDNFQGIQIGVLDIYGACPAVPCRAVPLCAAPCRSHARALVGERRAHLRRALRASASSSCDSRFLIAGSCRWRRAHAPSLIFPFLFLFFCFFACVGFEIFQFNSFEQLSVARARCVCGETRIGIGRVSLRRPTHNVTL